MPRSTLVWSALGHAAALAALLALAPGGGRRRVRQVELALVTVPAAGARATAATLADPVAPLAAPPGPPPRERAPGRRPATRPPLPRTDPYAVPGEAAAPPTASSAAPATPAGGDPGDEPSPAGAGPGEGAAAGGATAGDAAGGAHGAAGGTGAASAAAPGPDAEAVRLAVQAAVRYPRLARQRGIAGTVVVRFRISEGGSVAGAAVLRGADPALDREALDAVRRAAPFASPPGWVRVPVVFGLD